MMMIAPIDYCLLLLIIVGNKICMTCIIAKNVTINRQNWLIVHPYYNGP